MAGIWNVNSVYNSSSKKLTSKLSFDVGEVISARVLKMSENGTDLILKMLDGWQFPAELKVPLDHLPEGLIKFQIDGYEEGKIILKLINVPQQKDETENSIINILKEQNLSIDKDYNLLKEMVKHDIPLTKENISQIKTVDDFIDKISKNPQEEQGFISKYIESKNVDSDSQEGKMISKELGKFFQEMKTMDTDKLLTLFENNIDVNTDNIKSFNKILSGTGTIFKELKDISNAMNENQSASSSNVLDNKSETASNVSGKNIEITNESMPEFSNSDIENIKEYTEIGKSILAEPSNKGAIIDNYIKSKGIDTKSPEAMKIKETIEQVSKEFEVVFKDIEGAGEANEGKVNTNKQNPYSDLAKKISIAPENKDALIEKYISDKKIEPNSPKAAEVKNEVEKLLTKETDGNKQNVESHIKNLIKVLPEDVKQEVKQKIEVMKEIIKDVMEKKTEDKTSDFTKVMSLIKENINDFKTFNSISNQYYYVDIPLNLREDQYQCKLVIKDDRRKGKRIDTKNVKFTLSLNTKNIDVVDAYISIKNTIMNVDIKCNDAYVKVIEKAKEKLAKDLSSMGYNVYVAVDKKIKEMNLVNTREFFQDNTIMNLDVKV